MNVVPSSGANSVANHPMPSPGRAAYFECFSGASGDMILGALVDAGWPVSELEKALGSVDLDGWTLEVKPTKKGALRATQVTIRVNGPQHERTVLDIAPIIKSSRLSEATKIRVLGLFDELADVEALQHDEAPESVHFHEVGAVDSILDIVGAVAGLEALGVTHVYVSPINVGGGTVNTRDGILPVPGPATLELLRRRKVSIYATEYGPEFLTPTGALVLGCLSNGSGAFPAMQVEAIGYGAGQKDFRIPNVLRVSIGPLSPGRRNQASFSVSELEVPVGHDGAHDADHSHDLPTGHGHNHGEDNGHEHLHDLGHDLGHDLSRRPHASVSMGATESGKTLAGTATVSAMAPDGPTVTAVVESRFPSLAGMPHQSLSNDGQYVSDDVVQLETNIDNMSGEWFGHLTDVLLSRGALDVTLIPAQMKKGRPATIVSVLVKPSDTDQAVATIFSETTTLGIRVRPTQRVTLPRRIESVSTPFGPVRVKVATLGSSVRGVSPEFDDCREAALRTGATLQSVMDSARDAWNRKGVVSNPISG